MNNLFDDDYFEVKMVIPIHDIPNFSEIEIYQTQMTKIKVWADEVKEKILGSFTDESKSAKSNRFESNTFESKTTLKKEITFDN